MKGVVFYSTTKRRFSLVVTKPIEIGGNTVVSPKSLNKRIARLERDQQRLRASPSFRLGSHITKAIIQPWRAPFLIITLPWQMLMMGFELLGKKPVPSLPNSPPKFLTNKPNNTVVMFPTNGVGFGHFTRMLALAKRMKIEDPTLEVVFLTTMPTLHLLKPYGIPAHFISGKNHFQDMDATTWNVLLEEQITLCLETHKPKMFIFDGAFPYRGMLRAISNCWGVEKVWMRRGTFRKGSNIPVDSISHFDLIIHPKDSVPQPKSDPLHDIESISCPPIIMLDEEELMSREAARNRLMLPRDCKAVYVQLGAGEINDIDSEIHLTIKALTSHQNVYVVLGESMIGERLDINMERVHILRDYPNSVYFRGFDASVQAGGYNSFHETRRFGLPALFYPNMSTGMDDQLARCKVAEEEGWGKVLEIRKESLIQSSIEDLLNRIGEVEQLTGESGAWDLARVLLTKMGSLENDQENLL